MKLEKHMIILKNTLNTHIKHITEIPDSHHTRGISRDLVYFALKSLGVEAFDQFENSNLIEYISEFSLHHITLVHTFLLSL